MPDLLNGVPMLLYVKNMVCDRCIMIVKQQLESSGLKVNAISLGKIEVEPAPGENQLVEQIKTKVIDLIHYSDLNALTQSLTQLIADQLNKDYAYLSRQFSESEGLTIEKYIIQQKIEKVKELLEYGELNLNEIAYKVGYSSSAHLSTQFKSITGLTPSRYKTTALNSRKPLDKVI